MNDEDKAALQNEIDIMKQIDHPNIVKLFNIYEDEKYLYIVMELLGGGEVRFGICNLHLYLAVRLDSLQGEV